MEIRTSRRIQLIVDDSASMAIEKPQQKKRSSTLSKTKAKATTRKKKIIACVTKLTGGTPDQILMTKLFEQQVVMNNKSVSFVDILKELGMNDRNTKWRNTWRELEQKGYIQQSMGKEMSSGGGSFFVSGFHLTDTGMDVTATDEYKQAMKSNKEILAKPKTNQELHKQIKEKLMNKRGDEIFDLLLKFGSLSRTELSGKLGISDRGAYFSYALQQLKDLGYVEIDSDNPGKQKRLRLSDSAFVVRPHVEKQVPGSKGELPLGKHEENELKVDVSIKAEETHL